MQALSLAGGLVLKIQMMYSISYMAFCAIKEGFFCGTVFPFWS